MPPAKRKRKTCPGVASYCCISGRSLSCPAARTVLFVPSDNAQRVFEKLTGATESLYEAWNLDTTKFSATTIDALPESLGHVVTSVPEEGDLPEKEHQLLQLLIDGKSPSIGFLALEIRDGKRNLHDEPKWVAFRSESNDLLEEFKCALDGLPFDGGEFLYVNQTVIVGSATHPEIKRCGQVMELTKGDVDSAKEAGGEEGPFACMNVDKYLRGFL